MRDLRGRKGFGQTHRRSLVPAAILSIVVSAFGCGGGGGSNAVVAINDTYSVGKGLSISPGAPGVLSNDTGASLTALLLTLPNHGTVVFNADGSFTYTHNNDSASSDSFTYRASNSEGSADATVTITINQPPTAKNSCGTIQDNDPSVGVTLSGTDPNGNNTIASYTVPAPPSNGTLMECGAYPCTRVSPFLTYVPNKPAVDTGRRGMDKFTFNVTDTGGLGSIQTGTVTILNNGRLRIMPLGDSITEGLTIGSINEPPAGERVGYRRKLFNDLTALANGGYTIDFVGQLSNGATATPPIADPDHQGTPGERDDQVASNVISYLNTTPPDIILLHIGTNDFDTSPTDVRNILNNIQSWENANYPVTVFLARIIQDVDPPNLDVTTFNTNVANSLVMSDRVVTVNLQTGAGMIYSIDTSAGCLASGDSGTGCSGDMADDLHPNPNGYFKLATKWYTELTKSTNVGSKYLGLPQCQ